ncbi:MAG: MTAP family purine nucleoside phosphorylase [Candidatus Thorarchaeota archaeon]
MNDQFQEKPDKNIFGIIGGSGFYDFLLNPEKEIIETPFGSTILYSSKIENKQVYFLNRHGIQHSVPPHQINYKANIFALWKKGVDFIISTSAVGVLKQYEPSDIVILEQFVDFVSPPITFFDGKFELILHNGLKKSGVIHTDFTDPYCPLLRSKIKENEKIINLTIKEGGIYILSRGPRFETPAEIKIITKNNWGNVVGMTNPPEVILARELEMHYAAIGIVTNYAAGLSERKITHTEVLELFDRLKPKIKVLLNETIIKFPKHPTCDCIKYPK